MHTALEERCSPEERAGIFRWLKSFEEAVRGKDFAGARGLFAGDVFSFGTAAARAHGIEELEAQQWRPIWLATEGFAFEQASIHVGGHGGIFWVAAGWSSRGMKDGKAFERRGRASIILQRENGELLARHTHFSMEPAGVKSALVESPRDGTGAAR